VNHNNKIQERFCVNDYRELAGSALSESQIQNNIADALIRIGFLVIRMNSGAISDRKNKQYVRFYTIANTGKSSGIPDLMAIKNGVVHLLEVKTSKGQLTASQKDFISIAKRYGTDVNVVRSVDDALQAVGVS
jgi:hypothetical protein